MLMPLDAYRKHVSSENLQLEWPGFDEAVYLHLWFHVMWQRLYFYAWTDAM